MRCLLMVVLASALLAGCSDYSGQTSATVPPGWESLKPCNYGRTISVEEFSKIGRPGCNMKGTTIRFSNGGCYQLVSDGYSSWGFPSSGGGDHADQFSMSNWGVPGVAVSEFDRKDRLRKIWATSKQAYNLQSELDGKPWKTAEWQQRSESLKSEGADIWRCDPSGQK